MKKRLLCIAAAVLMVLAAVSAFGCEKQFPSEQEVLKSHLDKYCRENGEKIIEKYKNYFSGAKCSACYVNDSALVIEFRFDEKISDPEFQQRFAPDTGKHHCRVPADRSGDCRCIGNHIYRRCPDVFGQRRPTGSINSDWCK